MDWFPLLKWAPNATAAPLDGVHQAGDVTRLVFITVAKAFINRIENYQRVALIHYFLEYLHPKFVQIRRVTAPVPHIQFAGTDCDTPRSAN
jgi:hypothetical protein